MKVAAPNYDESIIVVKDGSDGYELRYWNRCTGGGPIGPRLARKTPMPNLPTKASTRMEAVELQKDWQLWLDERPARKIRKGRK